MLILSLLKGKTIAILGLWQPGTCSSPESARQRLQCRDRAATRQQNYDLAVSHGFKPVSLAEATKQGDLVNILLPDEVQGDAYRNDIKPNLKPGALLMCSHGFKPAFRPGHSA